MSSNNPPSDPPSNPSSNPPSNVWQRPAVATGPARRVQPSTTPTYTDPWRRPSGSSASLPQRPIVPSPPSASLLPQRPNVPSPPRASLPQRPIVRPAARSTSRPLANELSPTLRIDSWPIFNQLVDTAVDKKLKPVQQQVQKIQAEQQLQQAKGESRLDPLRERIRQLDTMMGRGFLSLRHELDDIKAELKKKTFEPGDLAEKQKGPQSVKAELQSVKADLKQVKSELQSVRAESTLVKAESKTVQAESKRVQAESKRVQAELTLVKAESKRVQAESKRVQAESKRVQAESMQSRLEQVKSKLQRVEAESMQIKTESQIVRDCHEYRILTLEKEVGRLKRRPEISYDGRVIKSHTMRRNHLIYLLDEGGNSASLGEGGVMETFVDHPYAYISMRPLLDEHWEDAKTTLTQHQYEYLRTNHPKMLDCIPRAKLDQWVGRSLPRSIMKMRAKTYDSSTGSESEAGPSRQHQLPSRMLDALVETTRLMPADLCDSLSPTTQEAPLPLLDELLIQAASHPVPVASIQIPLRSPADSTLPHSSAIESKRRDDTRRAGGDNTGMVEGDDVQMAEADGTQVAGDRPFRRKRLGFGFVS